MQSSCKLSNNRTTCYQPNIIKKPSCSAAYTFQVSWKASGHLILVNTNGSGHAVTLQCVKRILTPRNLIDERQSLILHYRLSATYRTNMRTQCGRHIAGEKLGWLMRRAQINASLKDVTHSTTIDYKMKSIGGRVLAKVTEDSLIPCIIVR